MFTIVQTAEIVNITSLPAQTAETRTYNKFTFAQTAENRKYNKFTSADCRES